MKAAILGSSGLVGLALYRALTEAGVEVLGTSHSRRLPKLFQIDLRETDAVEHFLDRANPSWVLIPAANPHVDLCEREPAQTRALNVEATLRAAETARGRGARVVFYSSDYVFDGEKGSPYIESDPTKPVNEYGRQKAEVEAAVLAEPGNLVIRTSGLFGWQHERKNFVLQVLDRAVKGEALTLPVGVVSNPTYADDLAELTVALIKKGASGCFHAVGSQTLAREDFARLICRTFQLPAPEIRPAPPYKQAAPRPKNSALSTAKLQKEVGRLPLTAEAALARMRADEAAWRSRWDLVSS